MQAQGQMVLHPPACLLPLARLPQDGRPRAEELAVREAQRGAIVGHAHETIVRLVICSAQHDRWTHLAAGV